MQHGPTQLTVTINNLAQVIAARGDTNITHLTVGENQLTPATAQALADLFMTNTNILNTLSDQRDSTFRHWAIKNFYYLKGVTVADVEREITHIQIEKNKITPELATILATMMAQNIFPSMRPLVSPKLSFKNCILEADALTEFNKAIFGATGYFKELEISGTQLNSKAIEELIILFTRSNITSYTLQDCKIDSTSATLLLEALKSNKRITTLKIDEVQGIDPPELQVVLDQIQQEVKLNNIINQDIRPLLYKGRVVLREVNNNTIAALCKMLRLDIVIKKIDLRYLPLTTEQATLLIAALEKSPHLTKIKGLNFSEPTGILPKKIQQLTQFNQKIQAVMGKNWQDDFKDYARHLGLWGALHILVTGWIAESFNLHIAAYLPIVLIISTLIVAAAHSLSKISRDYRFVQALNDLKNPAAWDVEKKADAGLGRDFRYKNQHLWSYFNYRSYSPAACIAAKTCPSKEILPIDIPQPEIPVAPAATPRP